MRVIVIDAPAKRERNMDIQINEKQKCDLHVRCTAGSAEIAAKEAEVMKLFQKLKVPGTREGKANDMQIKQHYRQQVSEATKRAMAEEAYHTVLFEKNLRPHGPPKFTSIVLLAGHFSCEFDMFTKPNFEMAKLEDLEVVKPHSENNAENDEVQKTLQELRVKYGEATPYDDNSAVEMGDNVLATFSGSIDGKVLDFLKGENEMITVGQTGLKEIDDQLIGMKPGEKKEFDFVAPSGGLASLAGKTVHFEIEVMTGTKMTPAPLDDSLAQKLGQETFASLQEYVRGLCARRVQQKEKMKLNDAIQKVLLENHQVEVPSFLTESEAKYLAAQAKLDLDTLAEEDKKQYLEMAEKNVKISLILDLIRENEPRTQLSDEEVVSTLKHSLSQNQSPETIDETLQQMQKTGQLNILAARMKDEFLLGELANIMKVKE